MLACTGPSYGAAAEAAAAGASDLWEEIAGAECHEPAAPPVGYTAGSLEA